MRFPDSASETPEWKPESKVLGLSDSQALSRASYQEEGQGNASGGGGLSKFSLESKGKGADAAKPLDPDKDSWVTQVIPSKIHWTYGPSGKRVAFLKRHDNGSNPGPV